MKRINQKVKTEVIIKIRRKIRRNLKVYLLKMKLMKDEEQIVMVLTWNLKMKIKLYKKRKLIMKKTKKKKI